jgi:hypothetical protein
MGAGGVKKECNAAEAMDKRVVPILIDLQPEDIADSFIRFNVAGINFDNSMKYVQELKRRARR